MAKLALVFLFWSFAFASIYFACFGIWNTAITLLVLSFLVDGIIFIDKKLNVF